MRMSCKQAAPTPEDRAAATTGLGEFNPVTVGRFGGFGVVDLHGPLSAVAGPAREAVLAQWVQCPAAVLCDLSDVAGPFETGAVAVLASIGAQVRQWPGIPIGLVCPDRSLRDGLTAAAEGQFLAIGDSRAAVWGALSAEATTATVHAALAPEPSSARAARQLVAAACSDWGCSAAIPPATLVASELVTNAVVHARTQLQVSFSRCGHQLRLAVRDHSNRPPTPRMVGHESSEGRGMLLVEATCASWGVLLTAGGKVVWAVLPA
jgi:anti-sigma regulatory factor (Ser/Thr protein kinase)